MKKYLAKSADRQVEATTVYGLYVALLEADMVEEIDFSDYFNDDDEIVAIDEQIKEALATNQDDKLVDGLDEQRADVVNRKISEVSDAEALEMYKECLDGVEIQVKED